MTRKGERLRLRHPSGADIPVLLEARYAAARNRILLVDATEESNVVVTESHNHPHAAQARDAKRLLVQHGNAALAQARLKNRQRHSVRSVFA